MTDNIPPPPSGKINFDEIVLYGVPIGTIAVPFDEERLKIKVKHKVDDAVSTVTVSVLAYGYAFEGGCYRFDAPRILVIKPSGALAGVDAVGCGFGDIPAPDKYKMWRIRSADDVVDLAISVGRASDLVLEASLPGGQMPNTYRKAMAIGHRGRRMRFEPGG